MKKKMILVAVIVGAIASFGVLRAMNSLDQLSGKDLAIGPNEHHEDVPQQDTQKELPAASKEGSSLRIQAQGIEGRVMDRRGNPVAGVDVFADTSDQGPRAGALLKSSTDKEGHFLIKGIRAGTYEVYVVEKDDQFCPTCLFDSGGITPPHVVTVNVLEGQTSNIVLEKPPKSAKLTGRIFDADTNEPIVGSRITLRRVDNPNYYLKTGPREEGDFVISVPPVPITMEVTAVGYEPWNYVRDDLPPELMRVDSIKLERGESRKLEVRLRKKAPDVISPIP